jgi:nucleotidyltransferase-like protein
VASLLFNLLDASVPQLLRRHGVTAQDLRLVPEPDPHDSVILAGSYARGEATVGSDLDLAIICAEPPPRAPATRGYPSVFGDSVVVADVNGLIVNVEFLRREMLQTICTVLASVPGDPTSPSIANLGPLELRILERAGSGIVLQTGRYDQVLLAGIDLAKARANTAAISFIVGIGHLRAASHPDAQPAVRAYRLGRAAEELLIAEVNALGSLTFDGKHLIRRADRLLGEGNRALLSLLVNAAGSDSANGTATDSSTDSAIGAALRREANGFVHRLADPERADIGVLLRPLLPGIRSFLDPV